MLTGGHCDWRTLGALLCPNWGLLLLCPKWVLYQAAVDSAVSAPSGFLSETEGLIYAGLWQKVGWWWWVEVGGGGW